MTHAVTVLADPGAVLGESPVWMPSSRSVLWVDMPAGAIHTSASDGSSTSTITVDTYLGAVSPTVGGGYVAAVEDGFAAITPQGSLTPLHTFLSPEYRMNDAKCDPAGNFVAGSVSFDFRPGEGTLHVLTRTMTWAVLLEGLTQPNGLGWSLDGRTLYLIDTAEGELCRFAYDPDGVSLSARQVIRRFDPADGYADGMCVDAAGCLWIAFWDGGRIERLDPEGDVLETVHLTIPRPTSCAFIGERLDTLAVTTAQGGDGEGGGELLAIGPVRSRGLAAVPFGGVLDGVGGS